MSRKTIDMTVDGRVVDTLEYPYGSAEENAGQIKRDVTPVLFTLLQRCEAEADRAAGDENDIDIHVIVEGAPIQHIVFGNNTAKDLQRDREILDAIQNEAWLEAAEMLKKSASPQRRISAADEALFEFYDSVSNGLSISQVEHEETQWTEYLPPHLRKRKPSKTGNYTVQQGDNLWSLAKKFDTSVDELARLNNINEANRRNIYEDELLFMPVSPTIEAIIRAGRANSETFAVLLQDYQITPDNYENRIKFGNSTETLFREGKITIEEASHVGNQVLKLAHELTNLRYAPKYNELMGKVLSGEITPKEYAKAASWLEWEGQINQIIVAAESGFRFEGEDKKELNDFIDEYNKNRSINLRKRVTRSTEHLGTYEEDAINQKKRYDIENEKKRKQEEIKRKQEEENKRKQEEILKKYDEESQKIMREILDN